MMAFQVQRLFQFDAANTTPRNVNASASATFTITPDARNDAPIFTFNSAVLSQVAPPTVTSQEDQGLVTFNDFLLDVLPGPLTALDELANQQIIQPILVEALDPSAFDGPTGQPRLTLKHCDSTRYADLSHSSEREFADWQQSECSLYHSRQRWHNEPRGCRSHGCNLRIRVNAVNDAPSFTLPTRLKSPYSRTTKVGQVFRQHRLTLQPTWSPVHRQQ